MMLLLAAVNSAFENIVAAPGSDFWEKNQHG